MSLRHLAKASVIVFVLASAGCKDKDDVVDCNFDESAMLTNYADNVIIPAFVELKSSLNTLKTSVTAFASTPSTTALNTARTDFENAFIKYLRCSMFGMGPGTVGGVVFRERLNTYPTTLTTLEINISNGSTDIENNGRATVGLPAVAYLLYHVPGTSASNVVDMYTDQDGQLRKDYLMALVIRLEALINEIESGWTTTYRSEFISNTGTADGSSLGLMVNELSYDYELRKNFGFKVPLGKFNGGIPLPEECEGYHARISAELSEEHVAGLKAAFTGGTGQGIDDYLGCLETAYESGNLVDAINAQFQTIEAGIVAIPDPMSETLTSDYSVVDDAYIELSTMVPLFKREMSAALGVNINYQSGDGD